MPAPRTSFGWVSFRRGRSNHTTAAEVDALEDKPALKAKARSMPFVPGGEEMEDFFFRRRSSRSRSRSPLKLRKNGSGCSTLSGSTIRTVSSLRDSPACPLDILDEETDADQAEEFLAIRRSIHFIQANSPSRDDADVPPVILQRISSRGGSPRGSSPPGGSPPGGSKRSVLEKVKFFERKQHSRYPTSNTLSPKSQYSEAKSDNDISCVSSVTMSQPNLLGAEPRRISPPGSPPPPPPPPCSAGEAPKAPSFSPPESPPPPPPPLPFSAGEAPKAPSEVSLTATDVKLLVKALKRAAGDDFTGLIESIKKKQEPDLSRWQRPQPITMTRANNREQREESMPFVEPSVDDSENDICSYMDDGNELGGRGGIEVASNAPSAAIAPDKVLADDDDDDDDSFPDPFNISDSVNSLLDDELASGSSGSSSSGIELGRKISFSPEEHVRLYDLTKEEVLHKSTHDEIDDGSHSTSNGDSTNDSNDDDEEEDNNDGFDVLPETYGVRQRGSKPVRQGGSKPKMFCDSGSKVDDAKKLLSKLYAGSVETAKGLQKKYEEKGWLKDSDGLVGYFKKVSESGDPATQCFCMAGRKPDVEDPKRDSFVEVIQTSESQEGMPSRDYTPRRSVSSTLKDMHVSKGGKLPAFAERRKAQQKMERSWVTVGFNPFREKVVRDDGSLVKIGSMSFDTMTSKTSQDCAGRGREGNAPNYTDPVTFIHLLERESDVDGGVEPKHRPAAKRFEC